MYDQTPDSTITVAFSGDDLTAQATGEPALRLLYLGVKDGRPRFYIRQLYAELEFVPDANGVYRSLVLHQAIFDVQATRH